MLLVKATVYFVKKHGIEKIGASDQPWIMSFLVFDTKCKAIKTDIVFSFAQDSQVRVYERH